MYTRNITHRAQVFALSCWVLIGATAEASAQGLIFSNDFESGRLCVWSSHPCDPAALLGLPAHYEQQASALIQSSSCVPPSDDLETMTKLVAMALLQRAISVEGIYSPFLETYPLDDDDGDGFSPLPDPEPATLRAKDCNDNDRNAHPMLADDGGVEDGNCNGVFGVEPGSGLSYEDLLCAPYEDTENLLVFGDALASGFNMDVSCLDGEFASCMETGLDSLYSFPWQSFLTGTDVADSIYLEVRDRDRCAHRQWMNLAVPDDEIAQFDRQVSRLTVPPGVARASFVVAFFGLGDICEDDLDSMTNPQDFQSRLLRGLADLDLKLAPGSVVLLLGLPAVNPMILLVENEIYPSSPVIGSPDSYTYSDVYEYLNCLEASSCPIITTSDVGSRMAATMRASEFDFVLQSTVQTQGFNNFILAYIDSDEVYQDASDLMVDAGIDPILLFTSFDGLHPRLEYSNFLAEALFDIMETRFPGLLNDPNPNNATIEALFGDQGGH
jgi:acyloxyacyl hydrolase